MCIFVSSWRRSRGHALKRTQPSLREPAASGLKGGLMVLMVLMECDETKHQPSVAVTRLAFLGFRLRSGGCGWAGTKSRYQGAGSANAAVNAANGYADRTEEFYSMLRFYKSSWNGLWRLLCCWYHTSVKKWGATWRVRLSARGPGWPLGAVLSPLCKEQRRGPRPHCLSDNWDVKLFTESSREDSIRNKRFININIKSNETGDGEAKGRKKIMEYKKGEEESTTQTLRTNWISFWFQTDELSVGSKI